MMNSGKRTLCILILFLLAACCCTPAAAWHANTDPTITPSETLMPGDTVTAELTLTILRENPADHRLYLTTDLTDPQWRCDITHVEGTPLTTLTSSSKYYTINGFILSYSHEILVTITLTGTVPAETTIGSSAVTPTPTQTITVTPTKTQTAVPTATKTLVPTVTPTPKPTPTVATLIASSSPSGADLFIDNNYKGFTPITQTDITPGTHVVTLKKEGYLSDEQKITFKAGATYEISFTLAEEPKASEVFTDLIKQYPTMALIGIILIGFGVLALLIRRKH